MGEQHTGASAEVRYEGATAGGELWGGTQANFIVLLRGPDKEAAVLLNAAAAALLADHLGVENTPAWRELAARAAGQAWIERELAGGRPLESLRLLSRSTFESDPALLAAVEQRLRAA